MTTNRPAICRRSSYISGAHISPFFNFIFDIIQLVVTSVDNNVGFIFSIKLNEPVGTGDQIRTSPGALSHQWPTPSKKNQKKTNNNKNKQKNRRFFFVGHFEQPWKQSFNRETNSYIDFNVAKRTETETEKPNDKKSCVLPVWKSGSKWRCRRG